MRFASTLAALLALNGQRISVSVSGPHELDPTLALLVGRQRDAEQLGGASEHWLFHLEPAGAYGLDEDDFVSAGYEAHGALVIRGRFGRLSIVLDEAEAA